MIVSNREKTLYILIVILIVLIVAGGTWYVSSGRVKTKADVITTTAPTTSTDTKTSTVSSTSASLTLKPGYNLVSIPYILSPNDGKTVFLGLASREAYYMNADGKWISFQDSGTVTPGQGIWVKSTDGELYKVPVTATAIDQSKPFTISLKKGWNAIGNPFLKDITWNPTVKTAKGTTSFKQAVAAKILSVGYISDPVAKEYTTVTEGDQLKLNQGMLVQAGGDNIDLIITP